VPGRRPPFGLRGPAGELRGRRSECDVQGQLLDAVRAGESRALVVRGESDQRPGGAAASHLDFQAEALQGGLDAWRSRYPVESTSDAAA
jgi:hypothetical protein